MFIKKIDNPVVHDFSNTFDRVHNKDTGLWLLKSIKSSFFNNGSKFAIFRMSGKTPFVTDKLNMCASGAVMIEFTACHDDVIKWKNFPRNWPFVRGIHRSPVNSQHKDQWRGALMFSLICVWINDWANNREAGDLRRYRAHFDVIVMKWSYLNFIIYGHRIIRSIYQFRHLFICDWWQLDIIYLFVFKITGRHPTLFSNVAASWGPMLIKLIKLVIYGYLIISKFSIW